MHIQVLYFEECPNYKEAIKNLKVALDKNSSKNDVVIDLRVVESQREAEKLKFIGSPTFIVDGRDLFSVPANADYGLRCRIYLLDGRATGVPSVEDFNKALSLLS